MTDSTQAEINRLLTEVSGIESLDLAELTPLVYDELRTLAEKQMRRERPDNTLQATALVHEVYLRLADRPDLYWETREQFRAMAAIVIRSVLIDHARGKRRQKRGGSRKRIPLDATAIYAEPRNIDLLALDEALTELRQLDERTSRIVEMRFFGGLNMREIATVLDVSLRTVEGDWRVARAWLSRRLRDEGPGD